MLWSAAEVEEKKNEGQCEMELACCSQNHGQDNLMVKKNDNTLSNQKSHFKESEKKKRTGLM